VICLLRPPAVEAWRFSSATIGPPLGLAYLAGSLDAAGLRYSVVDAVALAPTTRRRYHKGYLVGLPLQEIPARIPDDARYLGISIVFTHEWPAVAYLISLIKDQRPDLTIICGGEHITSMPEFSLATSEADVLVLGEGEETLVDLLNAYASGGPLADIPGLVYRDADRIVTNARRARRTDLDNIPWPAWQRFDFHAYSEHGFVGGMDVPDVSIPVLASRGCPYQCTFCSSPNMWTTRWNAREPKLVVDEIEHYMREYGARNFPFQDLTAIIKKDWIVEICHEIINRGLEIKWQLPTGTRSEVIDEEVARLLHRSGQIAMTYAPESGSERTRTYIKKKVKAENMLKSIGDCAKADLNIVSNVIIGFPHETDEFVAENIPFARQMKEAGCEDLAVVYYMALPGTEIFHSLFDAGKVRIDGVYFRHILQGVSLWPNLLFNDGRIGKLKLLYWKLRISLAFYGAKGTRSRQTGLDQSLWKAFTGIFTREHESRLQTAARHSLMTAYHTIRVQFAPGWMRRRDEAAFFKGWHEIYADLRKQLVDMDIVETMPADTSLIHKTSIVKTTRKDHQSNRALVDPGARFLMARESESPAG